MLIRETDQRLEVFQTELKQKIAQLEASYSLKSSVTEAESKKSIARALNDVLQSLSNIREAVKNSLNNPYALVIIINNLEPIKSLKLNIDSVNLELNQNYKISSDVTLELNLIVAETAFILSDIVISSENLNRRLGYLEQVEMALNLLNFDSYNDVKLAFLLNIKVKLREYVIHITSISEKIITAEQAIVNNDSAYSVNLESAQELERIKTCKKDTKQLLKNILDYEKNRFFESEQDFAIQILNISWKQYNALLNVLKDISWCKISYFNQVLDLMCPSRRHESISSFLSSIIEEYCFYTDTYCAPFGSTTLRGTNGIQEVGKEPDAAYAFSKSKEIPDLAIEVNFSSGNISDLRKYKILKIAEVWMWDTSNKLRIYVLETEEYLEVNTSKFLRNLSKEKIIDFIYIMEQEGLNSGKKEMLRFLDALDISESSS
ncbi:MAG: Uma2 family endonuclease [Cyanobacteria bacterium P01_G01_bin.39]